MHRSDQFLAVNLILGYIYEKKKVETVKTNGF